MQHEHRALESYGVHGSIRTPVPILNHLQDASGAEAFKRLGLLVLLAILGKVKSISKEVLHRAGQGPQVPFRASHPVQRLQGRRFVHLRSLYLHWYNMRGRCGGKDLLVAEFLPKLDIEIPPGILLADQAAHYKAISHLNYRSEEHTSELQSLRHLVCRLLLEN